MNHVSYVSCSMNHESCEMKLLIDACVYTQIETHVYIYRDRDKNACIYIEIDIPRSNIPKLDLRGVRSDTERVVGRLVTPRQGGDYVARPCCFQQLLRRSCARSCFL